MTEATSRNPRFYLLRTIPLGAIAVIFAAHFVVDSVVSFLAALLPLLRTKLGISLSEAGLLVSLLSMSNALAQPITAVVVDRWPHLPWLMVGLVGSAFFVTSVGWLPSYALVAAAIPFGGFMAGLSHPDMASKAGALSTTHRSMALSLFLMGGRFGFAFGPLIAIALAKWLGLEWLWVYTLVAFAAAAAVRWGLAAPERPAKGAANPAAGLRATVRQVRGPLLAILGVTLMRAIVNTNLLGLLPSLYVELGLGLWRGGTANAVMLASGALGVMFGGYLADHLGKRRIIITGILTGMFALLGFLWGPRELGLLMLAAVGVGTYLPMGVTIALAQDLLPSNRGFASSITLGFAWFMASFSIFPLTRFAEHVGLLNAFRVLPVFLALASLLALRLPKGEPAGR